MPTRQPRNEIPNASFSSSGGCRRLPAPRCRLRPGRCAGAGAGAGRGRPGRARRKPPTRTPTIPRTSSSPASARNRDGHPVGHLGGLRRRAGPRPPADDRRDAGAPAGRLGHLVRPQCLAAGAARLPGRAGPDPHRRHRQPRRLQHQRRPCRRDQSADRRPDRGAARARRRLLFGSSAIGGVVNVIDARIPRRVPDEAVHVDGILTYGSAAERALGQRRGRRADRRQVRPPCRRQLQQDRRSRDRRLRAVAARCAPQAAASADPAIRALADLRGRLPNSAGRDLGRRRRRRLDRRRQQCRLLGQPLRQPLRRPGPLFARSGGRGRGGRGSTSRQTRVDGRAEIDAGGGFVDSVRFRGGYSDYRHYELEDTGDDRHDLPQQGL